MELGSPYKWPKWITGDTRWAPTSYKLSYNPYRWPYKWVTGVITLLIGVITQFITGRGPPCITPISGVVTRLTSHDPWPGAPPFFAPKTRSRSPRPPSAAPPKTPPLSSEPVDFVQSQGRDAKMLLRQRLARTTVCSFDPGNLSLEITLPETNISPENGWLED